MYRVPEGIYPQHTRTLDNGVFVGIASKSYLVAVKISQPMNEGCRSRFLTTFRRR